MCVSVQTDKMIDVLCKILYHNSRFLKIYTICESIFNGTAFSFRSSDTFFNMLSIFFSQVTDVFFYVESALQCMDL